MTTSSRKKRYRERRDNGKAVLHVEVNLFEFVEMLVDIGMLKAWDDNNRRTIEEVTAKFLETAVADHKARGSS